MLDQAIKVFRRRGYHAASISELVDATGLTEGSLYKAFNGKEALFLACFDRYCSRRQAELSNLLTGEQSGAEKLRAAVRYYVSSSSGNEGKLGCLIVGSVSSLDLFDIDVAARIRHALHRNVSTLKQLIELGITDGSLHANTDPDATAQWIWCMLIGIRVAGKAGVKRSELDRIVDQAFRLLR